MTSNGTRIAQVMLLVVLTAERCSAQNCQFANHGRILGCSETTTAGNEVKYSVPCPRNATSSMDCLANATRICYQYNGVPCVGSWYCDATQRFYLNCSNIFASDTGATCSTTDCSGACLGVAPSVTSYNKAAASDELFNSCTRLGLADTVECDGGRCAVTTEWKHILADSTEIEVTGVRDASELVFETCQVEIADSNNKNCPCSTDCPPLTSTISL